MFSNLYPDLRRPLALRLTLWYAGIFAVSSALAFGVLYFIFVSVVRARTDDDLEEDIQEFASFMQHDGLERVRSEIAVETSGNPGDSGYQLWTGEGRLLAAGRTGPASAPAEGDEPFLATLGRSPRVRWIEGAIAPGYVMRIGQSLEDDDAFIADFRNGFLLTLAAIVLLGAPVGWFLARRALRPIEALTRTAVEIADGALERRVPVGEGGDELALLARAFNAMLDRIQALIEAMREMTDNMAHDLRNPVARIRASSEMTLAGGESTAGSTLEECDRLMDIIDTTLDIAEAESGAARLNMTPLDLSKLVLDACDIFKTAAEDHEILLTAHVPDACSLSGDQHRLQRVLANLIDNAIKYTPAGGHIRIALEDDGPRVRLSVQDTGPGIDAEDLPHIFQRFYRGDRSRSGNGNGLGLSLALAFARAHGGDLTAQSTPGEGSTFTIVLPRAR